MSMVVVIIGGGHRHPPLPSIPLAVPRQSRERLVVRPFELRVLIRERTRIILLLEVLPRPQQSRQLGTLRTAQRVIVVVGGNDTLEKRDPLLPPHRLLEATFRLSGPPRAGGFLDVDQPARSVTIVVLEFDDGSCRRRRCESSPPLPAGGPPGGRRRRSRRPGPSRRVDVVERTERRSRSTGYIAVIASAIARRSESTRRRMMASRRRGQRADEEPSSDILSLHLLLSG
mmetsp:Transcript_31124/g.75247  ORF Transcript_31124/g.75247 Transcript_31124/m.75247 type:complete len:229 (+) Transcript_31124:642-1328(+)